jgi:hypothetical protein
MVLSGSKMTTYRASITNVNQGGGSKKAGLPPVVGISAWGYVAYAERGDGDLNLVNMRANRFKVFPNQNLPVGFHRPIQIR